MKGKVFVGLSGGVDSAVSAALLQRQGWDVTGVFIKIVIPGYTCTAGADKLEAMRVAATLDIPFLELDVSKEYYRQVFYPSIKEFAKGETPNPDILCNREIKFGKFFEFAKSRGADFIATGHYAQLKAKQKQVETSIAQRDGASIANFQQEIMRARRDLVSVELLSGADIEKDQSYFLWAVPETTLRYTMFPVGSFTKKEVRALAKKFGLPNAERKDSQGLCFLGPISMHDMLTRELSPQPGDVLDESGTVVGSHRGAILYTLGERRGLTLFAHSPVRDTPPHFVVAKNTVRNTVTVSESRFPKNSAKTTVNLRDCNWIGNVVPGTYETRFRYRQKLILAQMVSVGEKSEVFLQEPHYVPLAQSLVLYDGERCLGGGIIVKTALQ